MARCTARRSGSLMRATFTRLSSLGPELNSCPKPSPHTGKRPPPSVPRRLGGAIRIAPPNATATTALCAQRWANRPLKSIDVGAMRTPACSSARRKTSRCRRCTMPAMTGITLGSSRSCLVPDSRKRIPLNHRNCPGSRRSHRKQGLCSAQILAACRAMAGSSEARVPDPDGVCANHCGRGVPMG